MKGKKEKSSNNKTLYCFSAFLVVVISVILVIYPQPELDWEGYVLPLTNQFMKTHYVDENNSPLSTIDYELPLKGINVVISGATSGIGLGLTKNMVKLGATVIAIGRNPKKLAALQETFGGNSSLYESREDGNNENRIYPVVANYNDLETVSQAAEEILSSFGHIDILINNAGIHEALDAFAKNTGVQGYDEVFTVNYLSHVLLTDKLLPSMKQSKRPTIVQISSSYHWAGNWVDLVPSNNTLLQQQQPPLASLPGGAPAWYVHRTTRGYANSKLAQIFHAKTLKRKYSPTLDHFRIVSICPAWVGTQIGSGSGSGSDSSSSTMVPTFHGSTENAFPFAYDGFGLKSTFRAIFGTDQEDNTSDYYTNTRVLNFHCYLFGDFLSNVFPRASSMIGQYLFTFSIRDFLINVVAFSAFPTQKFLPMAEPAISNPITNDETIQDQLYDWSMEAIKHWV